MKKLLFLLLIVFACKKEQVDPNYWICKTTTTWYINTQVKEVSYVMTDPCGKTGSDIFVYQESMSGTRTEIVRTMGGDATHRYVSVCDCKKK